MTVTRSGREGAARRRRKNPSIVVTDRHMPEMSSEAFAALVTANDPPKIFVRGGRLVRVLLTENGRPYIDDLSEAALKGQLARCAKYFALGRGGKRRATEPPKSVVVDILASGEWDLPPLAGLIETPALRPDGTVIDRPGYDGATSMLYIPARGLARLRLPPSPTDDEIAEALKALNDLLQDFRFVDQASRANAFGLLLTPILRTAIDGPTPLFVIDKPQPGTGATLLAAVVSLIATGRDLAPMTAPRDGAEWSRSLLATLRQGEQIIAFDNVEEPLSSGALSAVLTATEYTGRELGKSSTLTIPQQATWIATGNNIQLGGDIARRSVLIRMDAQTARPWERERFAHPDLLSWAQKNRKKLIRSLLVMTRAWYAAGSPAARLRPMGSFDGWARTIGGVLAHAGVDGFLENRDQVYEQVDDEGPQWAAFLGALVEATGGEPKTSTEIVGLVKTVPEFEDTLPYELDGLLTDAQGAMRLGKALRARLEKRFDDKGLRVVRARPDKHGKKQRWRVVRG